MLLSILQELIKADKAVFYLINHAGNLPLLDWFMLGLRNQNTWIPLYLLVLYKVYKGNPKMLAPFIAASLLTFLITDYTSASIIKPWAARLRPCHDTILSSTIHILVDCGGQYGFPSSHAANHFGLAMIWYKLMAFLFDKKWRWVWPWATAICYAQIYVGKHFPLDTVAGALLGIFAGLLVFKLFEYWYNHLKRNNNLAAENYPKPLTKQD
jgi:undecaprenyl-diphosphatase